jgi:hypothetical protein
LRILRIYIVLLVFILLVGSSLCQSSTKEVGQNNRSASQNSTLQSLNTLEKTAEIQGIWSFNLKGTEQVTAALHQSGGNLFGSSKSEASSSWNAVVTGYISGTSLELIMTVLKNNSLTSTKLSGTYQNDSVTGTFVRSDDLGNFDTGLFRAVLTSKDLSGYSPAKSAKPALQPAVNEPASVPVSSVASAPASAAASQTQPKQLGDPKYVDVHSMSGYVPESLGVGFVGDGTMGAGGSSMG